jgi:hypothetical protein
MTNKLPNVLIIDGYTARPDKSAAICSSQWVPDAVKYCDTYVGNAARLAVGTATTDYATWEALLDAAPIHEQITVISARLGAYATLRWLCERRDAQLDRLVLVEPSLAGTEPFDIDRGLSYRCQGRIAIIYGVQNDTSSTEGWQRLEELATALPEAELYGISNLDFRGFDLPQLHSYVAGACQA